MVKKETKNPMPKDAPSAAGAWGRFLDLRLQRWPLGNDSRGDVGEKAKKLSFFEGKIYGLSIQVFWGIFFLVFFSF